MEGRLDSLVTYGTEWWANLSVGRFRQLIRRCWEEALEAGREGVRDIARRGADGDVDGTLVDGNGGRAPSKVVRHDPLQQRHGGGPRLPALSDDANAVADQRGACLLHRVAKDSGRTKFFQRGAWGCLVDGVLVVGNPVVGGILGDASED